MEIPQDVAEAMREGKKIEAIKRLRKAKGLGLKEAKDAVEAWQAGHSDSVPAFRQKARGSLLLTLVVVAAFVWMFIHLVDVAASLIVLANKDGYQRGTFVIEKLQHRSSAKGGLTWGFEGTINEQAEQYFAPSLADGKALGFSGLRRLYPPKTKLEVWYNPLVTDTLFQQRTLHVLPYTEDLAAVEFARIRWWLTYCLLPFILVAVAASLLRERNV